MKRILYLVYEDEKLTALFLDLNDVKFFCDQNGLDYETHVVDNFDEEFFH